MKPLPDDIRLTGPMKPWPMEGEIDDCVVTQGEIPDDLRGGYYRNGPNMKRPTRQGAVGLKMADGMIHALIFENGKATYRNRWVRTPKFALEQKYGESLFEWEDGADDFTATGFGRVIRNELTEGVPAGTAATNACPFGDTILALCENAIGPVALDPITLETLGVVPWGSKLVAGPAPKANPDDGNFCSHPKWDETGRLYGWSYSSEPPYLTMEFVDPDGTVELIPMEQVEFASAVHDIWLTEDFIVVPIQGLYVSHDRVQRGLMMHGWDPSREIVLALISRTNHSDIRWINTGLEPQYVLHTMSANRDGDVLTLDAPIYARPPYPFEDEVTPGSGVQWLAFPTARLGRWVIDLATGVVKQEFTDDRSVEFPKMDERYYGKPYDNGFLLAGNDLWSLNTLVKRNMRTGATAEFVVDGKVSICEPQFAPRSADAPEGDGHVIAPVTYLEEARTSYLVFDTEKIEEGPVATIALPHQTPWTPHGCWTQLAR